MYNVEQIDFFPFIFPKKNTMLVQRKCQGVLECYIQSQALREEVMLCRWINHPTVTNFAIRNYWFQKRTHSCFCFLKYKYKDILFKKSLVGLVQSLHQFYILFFTVISRGHTFDLLELSRSGDLDRLSLPT